MRLHNLPSIKGATKSKKRVGRGPGSGLGKTSGRGQTGSKSRSGYSVRPGFEGGQMPLYLKLPRRGFSNARFKEVYSIVNVGDLERVEGDIANRESLIKAGLIRQNAGKIKILGVGELARALNVSATKFSASARQKIEASGGKVVEES
ncbi:MAG TPA: 50S ribosomal protein L15 [Opitutae bacterium]|nr:50S ribosomal protein L15 [Opitutae bacterium]|tara:strand:+ start:3754 stop:4197 length:444 start_codon:yes stop_codon:yes gene_type:complete